MQAGRESKATARCFAPVFNRSARILVLGSMPGVRSLDEQRYYAHPRNAFWPIMAEVVGFDPALDYPARLDRLRRARIALWDVIATCRRRGSLDQRIEPASVVANDFTWLFAQCPMLARVVFNGRAAEQAWARHVQGRLPPPWSAIERLCMPSTSPAHAAMRFEDKRAAWAGALSAPV